MLALSFAFPQKLLVSKDVRASQQLLRHSKALSERHRGLLGTWTEEEKRWKTHVELKELRSVPFLSHLSSCLPGTDTLIYLFYSQPGDGVQLDPIDAVPHLVDESGPFLNSTNSRALSIGVEELWVHFLSSSSD